MTNELRASLPMLAFLSFSSKNKLSPGKSQGNGFFSRKGANFYQNPNTTQING
jgi:hypothetical protein